MGTRTTTPLTKNDQRSGAAADYFRRVIVETAVLRPPPPPPVVEVVERSTFFRVQTKVLHSSKTAGVRIRGRPTRRLALYGSAAGQRSALLGVRDLVVVDCHWPYSVLPLFQCVPIIRYSSVISARQVHDVFSYLALWNSTL